MYVLDRQNNYRRASPPACLSRRGRRRYTINASSNYRFFSREPVRDYIDELLASGRAARPRLQHALARPRW